MTGPGPGVGVRVAGPVRRAATTMTAVLGALATTVVVRQWTEAPLQVTVLAVVLCLTLSRSVAGGVHLGVEAIAEILVVACAAGGVAWLLVHVPWLGEGLLVLGLSVGILARRWDGVVRRTGRVVAHPFLAVLVTPVPVVGAASGGTLLLWAPLGAVVAAAWTAGLLRLTRGWTEPGHTPTGTPAAAPRRRSRKRVDVPTRMALQMAVGLATALVLGRVLFDERWAWCVLSAYIVASGNRGRGDVAHKAGLRIVGALAGTVLATVAFSQVPVGHGSTLVALFVVMAVCLVLRERSYAFWAAGMTAMLSLLHAYYGTYAASGLSPAAQLIERLAGVVLGSAVGLLAAWVVLPVRTRDVFRGRVADCLAALTAELGPEPDGQHPAPPWPDALARLDEIRPGIRAAARHHPRARSQLAALDALATIRLPDAEPERRQLRGDVIRVRRSLVGRDDPVPADLAPALRPVLEALRDRRHRDRPTVPVT